MNKSKVTVALGVMMLLLVSALAIVLQDKPPVLVPLGYQVRPDGFRVFECRVENRGWGSIYGYGYAPDSLYYGREVLVGGKWEDDSPGWCGTGAQDQRIGPRSSVVIELDPEVRVPKAAWRIRLQYTRFTGPPDWFHRMAETIDDIPWAYAAMEALASKIWDPKEVISEPFPPAPGTIPTN